MKLRLVVLTGWVLLTGCIVSTTPYQKRGLERLHAPAIALEDLETNRILQLDVEGQSIERYAKPEFSIGIVEFSEEGELNPAQYQQVMDLVREELKEPAILILFAHGWHHGCSTCDRDLTCFRRVLQALAARELNQDQHEPRRVVGLYLGWRGRRFRGSADWVSIWDRKDRANHIGRTGAKEFLTAVHHEWEKVQRQTTMVSVGHSLGGVMLFGAVKERLSGLTNDVYYGDDGPQRVVRTAEPRFSNDSRRAVRARFGDLVVLVNPALEAKEYQVFDSDLRDARLPELTPEELIEHGHTPDRLLDYSEHQLPVLITVASTADRAVGTFFPWSRFLAGVDVMRNGRVFTSSKWRRALGHYAPFTTHDLSYTGPSPVTRPADGCACPENYDWGFEESAGGGTNVEQRISVKPAARLGAAPLPEGTLRLAPVDARDCEDGPGCRGWDPRSPFLVVRTDETVIRHHNDIFNPIFIGFLIERMGDFEKSKRGQEAQAY